MQQTCAATICTYINSILPCIIKLEQTVLELQQRITTDQDRVQINALDYDPDIDGLQPPRRHVNTAVVSVQDHFTQQNQRFWMLQNHKQKTIQQKSQPPNIPQL